MIGSKVQYSIVIEDTRALQWNLNTTNIAYCIIIEELNKIQSTGAIPTRGYSDSTYKSNWKVISIVEIAPLALLSLFAYSIKMVARTWLKQEPTCSADNFLCNTTSLEQPRVSASL